MKMKAIAVTLVLLSTPAYSIFVETYSVWERLTDISKGFYLAGVLDTMLEYDPELTENGINHRFRLSQCVEQQRSGITFQDLQKNLQVYVDGHPALLKATFRHALEAYLQELCGLPKPDKK